MGNYTQYIVIAIAIIFLVYRRIKNAIGFQQYSRNKLWEKIILFSVGSVLLLAVSITKPLSLVGDLIGIIIGLGLMYLATKNLLFEQKKDGLYYRTHIWVELAILVLFFARFSFRFYSVYQAVGDVQTPEDIKSKLQNINDPYTAGTVLVLCTYYISYFLVVLKRGKHIKALEE